MLDRLKKTKIFPVIKENPVYKAIRFVYYRTRRIIRKIKKPFAKLYKFYMFKIK